MTTEFGAATPCSRAARFGVSPTTPRLLGLPGADKIADDDQASCDPYAHLERLLDSQPADRLDERQPCPNCPLRIVLVGLRIPEIYEHPIAHVLGHEAVESGNRLRDALVIGTDHSVHVLGVELGREGSRANEVRKHDGELPAFSGVLSFPFVNASFGAVGTAPTSPAIAARIFRR
jgi:hypothetical protein